MAPTGLSLCWPISSPQSHLIARQSPPAALPLPAPEYRTQGEIALSLIHIYATKNPPYGGEVTYGERAEHCWNGDPSLPNAYSRLHYNTCLLYTSRCV